jgi:hypothetical protein
LFDNPVRVFSLDELAETVRALERARPGLAVGELARSVFAELAMKRTRRAEELVAEAIRMARTRPPRPEMDADGSIPEQAIAAYNETHPDRPY